jgi:hypothetical protein
MKVGDFVRYNYGGQIWIGTVLVVYPYPASHIRIWWHKLNEIQEFNVNNLDNWEIISSFVA